jgi:hypothetical protein
MGYTLLSTHLYFFVNSFLKIFVKNFKKIAHNVPAVCDVFAARIRALRKQSPGLQKCGWNEPWEALAT